MKESKPFLPYLFCHPCWSDVGCIIRTQQELNRNYTETKTETKTKPKLKVKKLRNKDYFIRTKCA